MATRKNSHGGLKRRQEAAKERQAARDLLSSADQLAKLDSLFGEGKGAVKERARLAGETNPKRRRRKKKARANES
jgi:hypothetical protein